MRPIGIQLKYGPWRDALLRNWKEVAQQMGFRRSDVEGRVQILTEALRAMCIDMDGVDASLWSASLGKNISHANGPLATLNRLGILTVKKKHVKSRRLRVGQGTGRWLCSGVLAMKRVCSRVAPWVRLADSCQVTAPQTCQEWVSEYIRVNQIFQSHGLFANKSYMRSFVIRGLVLAAMAAAGIPKLTGAAKIQLQTFASAFPDQRGWINKLSGDAKSITLAEFLADIGYDGRPEFLTMFMCLLLTPSMRVNPAWLLAHRSRLCESMVSQHECHGIFKLPALCVQQYRG